MIYFANNPSKLKINTIDDFQFAKPYKQAPTATIGVQIPGNLHNWHNVPLNQLGFYMTEAEMQCMVENFDEVSFKSVKCIISNVIPLAKYASTTNSTQLSFNNTIYSLLAQDRTNYVGVRNGMPDLQSLNVFSRTFDGVSANDAQERVSFPVHPITFKVPWPYADTNDTFNDDNSKTTVPIDVNNIKPYATANNIPKDINFDNVNDLDDMKLTFTNLIDCYIPEFLQNNEEVYILYPGENQYIYEWGPSNNKYNTIELHGPHFDELMNSSDIRFQIMQNNNLRNPIHAFAMIEPFPQAKGFDLDYPDIFSSRDQGFIPSGVPTSTRNQSRLLELMQNLQELWFKRDYDDSFCDIMPKLFIKGCPIVASDNNLVPHEFLCLTTWELQIEGKDRLRMHSNRLQWAMTYHHVEKYINQLDVASTAKNKFSYRNMYTKGFPKKPTLLSRRCNAKLKMLTTHEDTALEAESISQDVGRNNNKLLIDPYNYKTQVAADADQIVDDQISAAVFKRKLPYTGMNVGFENLTGFSANKPS